MGVFFFNNRKDWVFIFFSTLIREENRSDTSEIRTRDLWGYKSSALLFATPAAREQKNKVLSTNMCMMGTQDFLPYVAQGAWIVTNQRQESMFLYRFGKFYCSDLENLQIFWINTCWIRFGKEISRFRSLELSTTGPCPLKSTCDCNIYCSCDSPTWTRFVRTRTAIQSFHNMYFNPR